MTTLRLILDELHDRCDVGRYTRELAREIILTAPQGCYVEGFVSASPESFYGQIRETLPGLARLHKSPLARRELRAAWQHGFTVLPGSGMVHAPSPFAPLTRHDRLNNGDQIIVTIHDALAWTHPESMGSRAVAWHKAMARRAQRYADAVVVPTHSVADALSDLLGLGDRVRVISGAPSSTLAVPVDARERAARLALPESYVLARGGPEPGLEIEVLIKAISRVPSEVPLLIVGVEPDNEALATLITDAGLADGRIRALGTVDDQDLSVLIAHATVFAAALIADGFGLPVLDAFALGAPVVHSDSPELLELAADSGLVVPRAADEDYPERLGEALTAVIHDAALAERLYYAGRDRAKMFSWRASAEKVWQLHADL